MTPTDPYAMVLADSEAETSLQKAGWILTDSYKDGWRHYEPPPQ